MHLHYLQHVPFEDAANIAEWARSKNYRITCTKLYDDEPLPSLDDIDLLAIMGGPMNVYQFEEYPWLKRETEFIAAAIDKNIATIGVCLGGQLISVALDGQVTRNPETEIGWFPVNLTDQAKQPDSLFEGFPETFLPFHWHGDTFSVPKGAIHLAGNATCTNQAYQYKNNVIGLQFHLEYAVESIETMFVDCADEIVNAPFIQTVAHMRTDIHQRVQDGQSLLKKLLNRLEQTM